MNKSLRETDKEEEMAKQKMLQHELDKYEQAKKAVDQNAEKFAHYYTKEIQRDHIEKNMQNISEKVERSLHQLTKVASAIIRLAEDPKAIDHAGNIIAIEEVMRELEQKEHDAHPIHGPEARLKRLMKETQMTMTDSGLKTVQCEIGIEYSLRMVQLLHQLNQEENINDVDPHTTLPKHFK